MFDHSAGVETFNCTNASSDCRLADNHTDNRTDDHEDDHGATAGHTAILVINLVLYTAVFVCGIPGNGAVVWVAGFRMKRSPVTVYFLTLAAVDFTFVATLPLMAAQLLSQDWPFGRVACKLLPSFIVFNMYASVYLLAAISLDRYLAVVRPLLALRLRSARSACGACAVALCAAVLSTLPSFLYRDLLVEEGLSSWCVVDYGEAHETAAAAVGAFSLLAGFVVPLVAVCFCYARVVARMRGMSRVHSGRRARSVRLVAAVVVAFFACWLPHHLLKTIVLARPAPRNDEEEEASERFARFVNFAQPLAAGMAVANSCINPFLYVFVGREFRKTLLRSSRVLRVLEAALADDASSAGIAASQQGTKSSSDSGQTSQADGRDDGLPFVCCFQMLG